LDYERTFREKVIDRFAQSYVAGAHFIALLILTTTKAIFYLPPRPSN
jgi:hypothetical protein